MALLAVFLAIAVAAQVVNVSLCLVLERFYPASLTLGVFFVLWVGTFWLSWRIALHVTEPRTKPSADPQQLLVLLTTAAHMPLIA